MDAECIDDGSDQLPLKTTVTMLLVMQNDGIADLYGDANVDEEQIQR